MLHEVPTYLIQSHAGGFVGGSCAFQGRGAGYRFQAFAVGSYAVCINQTVQGQPLEGKENRCKTVTTFGCKPALQLCLGPLISPMLATSQTSQTSYLTSLNTSKRLRLILFGTLKHYSSTCDGNVMTERHQRRQVFLFALHKEVSPLEQARNPYPCEWPMQRDCSTAVHIIGMVLGMGLVYAK